MTNGYQSLNLRTTPRIPNLCKVHKALINYKSSFPFVSKDWSRIHEYVDEMWSQFAKKGLQKTMRPHMNSEMFFKINMSHKIPTCLNSLGHELP